MKKLFGIFALALAGTACQHQTPPTQAVAALPAAHSAVAPLALADKLTPDSRRLLAQHDLSVLLQTVTDLQAAGGPHIYNGFFGPARRRIEVVLTEARRDLAQPNLYYLRGKNRYKGIITPFAGTLVIKQVVDQPQFSEKELAEGYGQATNETPMYTALGSFVLREDSTHKNSGVFRGQVALDWFLNPEGELRVESRTSRTLSQNGGAKFEGNWTQYGATSSKPVVWVEDIFSYGPQVFNDFSIGERDVDFNPKYAKLGWNTYWTNDEWWGDEETKAVANARPHNTSMFTPPVVRADDSAATAE